VLVSIVIPTYNAERFVTETLYSALAQTVVDREIIVIDDGSTDGTPALLRSFGNAIQCEFGVNRGASAARNRGTALASGRYLQYLDADDLLEPEAVEKRLDALESSGADVAYSDWQRIREQDDGSFAPGELIAQDMSQVHPDPEIATFTSFWAPPAALLYSRGIVERIGGWNESLPVIQDARFLQDAALCGARFVHVAGIGARYRMQRGHSLSTRDNVAFARDVLRNAFDIQSIWQSRGPLSATHRAALASAFEFACRQLFFADLKGFQDGLSSLYEVQPGFELKWTKVAGAASGLLGYSAATALLRLVDRYRSNSSEQLRGRF